VVNYTKALLEKLYMIKENSNENENKNESASDPASRKSEIAESNIEYFINKN